MKENIRKLLKKAKQGNREAQYELGVAYALGEEVEQDFSKSRKWYSEAAKQGDFEASYNLGTMYLDGQGGEVNKPEGLKLLELAATAKNMTLAL